MARQMDADEIAARAPAKNRKHVCFALQWLLRDALDTGTTSNTR